MSLCFQTMPEPPRPILGRPHTATRLITPEARSDVHTRLTSAREAGRCAVNTVVVVTHITTATVAPLLTASKTLVAGPGTLSQTHSRKCRCNKTITRLVPPRRTKELARRRITRVASLRTGPTVGQTLHVYYNPLFQLHNRRHLSFHRSGRVGQPAG